MDQSIDLPMDCIAWRCWTLRQLNGCSTPVLRSSAAKQWFQQLDVKRELTLKRYRAGGYHVLQRGKKILKIFYF